MNAHSAVQFLQNEHRRLIGLFRQFEAIRERAPEMEKGVIKEILMETEVHWGIEEQLFYPALLSSLSSPENASVDAGIKEHRDFEERFSRIRAALERPRPSTSRDGEVAPALRETFADFLRDLEASLDREGKEVLPLARRLGDQDLSELAVQMRDLREELVAQPKYDDARPIAVEKPIYDYKQVPEKRE